MLSGETPHALYDVRNDPAEDHNMLASSPALAADLTRRALAFAQGAEEHDRHAAHGEVSDEVMEQLRALGYVD
jgi:hypothetical protein